MPRSWRKCAIGPTAGLKKKAENDSRYDRSDGIGQQDDTGIDNAAADYLISRERQYASDEQRRDGLGGHKPEGQERTGAVVRISEQVSKILKADKDGCASEGIQLKN